jgi:hypothetical protein
VGAVRYTKHLPGFCVEASLYKAVVVAAGVNLSLAATHDPSVCTITSRTYLSWPEQNLDCVYLEQVKERPRRPPYSLDSGEGKSLLLANSAI